MNPIELKFHPVPVAQNGVKILKDYSGKSSRCEGLERWLVQAGRTKVYAGSFYEKYTFLP